MSERPTITPRDNGPLVVKRLTRLVLADGSTAETKDVMALCRCGASKSKPFCDGSHKDTGFDGAGPGDGTEPRTFAYEGGGVRVTYTKALCSHAAECGRRLPAVFDGKQKPWVQPDKGTAEAIADVVRACPSGALKMTTGDGDTEHLVGGSTGITVDRDGPYRVQHAALETAGWSAARSREKYVLCRCGKSQAKPFCDGSHGTAGWKSGD